MTAAADAMLATWAYNLRKKNAYLGTGYLQPPSLRRHRYWENNIITMRWCSLPLSPLVLAPALTGSVNFCPELRSTRQGKAYFIRLLLRLAVARTLREGEGKKDVFLEE